MLVMGGRVNVRVFREKIVDEVFHVEGRVEISG